ncbi:efflux transporter periplasmic adaptor subunit [Inquilinus limosus]|uniref:Efflux transporter periplasmic adaptor subunit n=2 Tax=Inquilinus limosus TaxID=171674 RepID=A0A211ZVC6_9PROT|nr:efflux transporter periplasmic adaptor subunit [Inquilinus limosus]
MLRIGAPVALVAICAAVLVGRELRGSAAAAAPQAAPPPAVPVEAAAARRGDVPVYLTGLGTVQALNTVTVKSRVDGQLQTVAYKEGQHVTAGQTLAQIDPRPFQAALDQAKATKAKDEAQLANAQLDLTRFQNLKQYATAQSVDTQKALIAQIQAQIEGDQAAIDNAATQLSYTTITSPLNGRTGIRLVDQGNIVHATDAGGLVVITQLHPITVIFTLPEEDLPQISAQMAKGPMTVFADTRGDDKPLDQGTLELVDNQIDQATGTIRLKATFPNKADQLWPGQFVDVRLLLRTEQNVVTVPSAAIQRGPDGLYVYAVKPDGTAEVRPVGVGQITDGAAVIESGLEAGDSIVTAGQYRLQPGTRVQVREAAATPAAKQPNA